MSYSSVESQWIREVMALDSEDELDLPANEAWKWMERWFRRQSELNTW